jgi:DNA-binding CsgD family transcriptional regulator
MSTDTGRTLCRYQKECAAIAWLQDELFQARRDLEALTLAARQTEPERRSKHDPPSGPGAGFSVRDRRLAPSQLGREAAVGALTAGGLTAREREVALALAGGAVPRQVADQLGIRTATVHKHLEHVYSKLGVHTQVAACAAVASLIGHRSQPSQDGAPRVSSAAEDLEDPHATPRAAAAPS